MGKTGANEGSEKKKRKEKQKDKEKILLRVRGFSREKGRMLNSIDVHYRDRRDIS